MAPEESLVELSEPTLIVTCAAGREGDARRELRKILGEIEARPLFMKGNLLVEAPGRPAEDVVAALREAGTQTIGRVVPVTMKAAIGPGREHLPTLAQAALAIARLEPGDTFKVECNRRGRHEFSSPEVQRQVGLHLEAHTPATFRFEEPGIYIFVEIYQDVAYLGRVARTEVIHKTITRMRIHAPGERPLNRAEHKLREALAAFGVSVSPGMRALDLGAAPGGWTKVLAQAGAEVLAIDPADLDPDIGSLPNVSHFRGRAAEVASLPGIGRFDLITDDMNCEAGESARLVLALMPLLAPGGAVIMTVKFMSRRRRQHLRAALEVLAPHFEEHREKRLPHNAKETTVFFCGPRQTPMA